MDQQKPPKALLFDIGGVCVVSPFQAILDYEIENNIPVGYINFSIQKGPHDTGAWQLIERGETELNDSWFEAFKAQLSVREHWEEYWKRVSVRENAGGIPAAAVAQAPPVPHIDAKKLFWRMMKQSRTPDLWMYPALKKLRASGRFVVGALSNTVAYPTGILDDEGILFDKQLVHPPSPWPYTNDSRNIADCFDVFISSAHVGVRKPDAVAYEMSLRMLADLGKTSLRPEEVLFIDDIGVNLKGAKKCGLRTLKVDLGKTKDTVRELERLVGMEGRLLEEGPWNMEVGKAKL